MAVAAGSRLEDPLCRQQAKRPPKRIGVGAAGGGELLGRDGGVADMVRHAEVGHDVQRPGNGNGLGHLPDELVGRCLARPWAFDGSGVHQVLLATVLCVP